MEFGSRGVVPRPGHSRFALVSSSNPSFLPLGILLGTMVYGQRVCEAEGFAVCGWSALGHWKELVL